MKILIFAILLCTPLVAHAQTLTSTGREFWLGFMPNGTAPAGSTTLHVASGYACTVNVELFDDMGKSELYRTVAIQPGIPTSISLEVHRAEARLRERADYRAIRVTSSAPVSVVGRSYVEGSVGAYLGLPLQAYGHEYYCVSYYDDAYQPGVDHLAGEMLVIAPYDSTQVTITTTATTTTSDDATPSRRPGERWSVTLMRGQTYLVQSSGTNWGEEDLTGTRIESNKPVAFEPVSQPYVLKTF